MDNNRVTKVALAAAIGLTAMMCASPANAQQRGFGSINKNALEKTNWHTSPREFQIIDDRPVVRDFREPPQADQNIDLPPGPGAGPGYGGKGGGSMDGGGPSSIPAGGMPMGGGGGGNLPYRTPPQGNLQSLPKSGFGRDTNIPARGMGPRGALPDGTNTNRLMGKMLNPSVVQGVAAPAAHHMSFSAPHGATGSAPAPKAASYGGDYSSGSGSGGSGNRSEGLVRGSLLRH